MPAGAYYPLAFPAAITQAQATAGMTWFTSELDLTQVSSGNVVVPVVGVGYFFWIIARNWLITASAGTLLVPPTTRVGNDAGHTNGQASSAANPTALAALAAVTNGVPVVAATAGFPTNPTLVDMTSPVLLDVTAGGTGIGLTLRARYVALGFLLKVS